MKTISRMPLLIALLLLALTPTFLLAQETISITPVPIATNDAATIVIPQPPPIALPPVNVPVLQSTPPTLTLPATPSTPLLNSIGDSFASGTLFAAQFPVGNSRDLESLVPDFSREQGFGAVTPVPEPSSFTLLIVGFVALTYALIQKPRLVRGV